jgi:imidazolonepropionase-like amidohydrolase
VTAAHVLRMEGKVGAIQPGAYADLLIVDANPLEDVGVLADPESHLELVMKGGQVYRDRLAQGH